MAAYRSFSVSHGGKRWATMDRATVRTCSTTMGNYGDVWATLATYMPFFGFARQKAMGNNGGIWATMAACRPFFGFARRKAMGNNGKQWETMGNNGSSHCPSLLDADGQLRRRLGNYGGVQSFFGFTRRKAMGNNGDVRATMSITERKECPTITKSSVHFRAFELSCFRDPFSSCLLGIPYFVISSVKVCSSSFDFDHSPCFIGFSAI